ncbi:AEC family transporter [Alkalihalobacillus trypoxylicola]|uniref:Transporter n=1 Tax=Alkalihalobacillus trypoxylicola TaxID=519424 RepID=A0A162DSM4_9BACI|nr:AEC family transporter [Alkalihalobacillus trypoxylicola]KYG30724.1 hypothetical protein AZF04_19195 [Alkalihalobacillus trypoxylicola]
MIWTFILAIGIIVLGLGLGKWIRYLFEHQIISNKIPLDRVLKGLLSFVLLGINPIILMGAFWHVELNDQRLFLLPLLGILTLSLGGVLALGLSKIYKLKNAQTGSMFVSGAFINIGSFGTLFCYLFLGEAGIAYAAMFRLFEELFYYSVCFPIAKAFGEKGNKRDMSGQKAWKRFIFDPFIMITFLAILIGGGLNISDFSRPDFFEPLNQWLVPLSSFLLVIPLGFSMRLTAVRRYLKESLSLSAVKFVVVPITIVSLALLVGMGEIYNGLLVKVILILSCMPPAVSSLVPPQLYKLDVDLANANWIVNTALLIIVLPILYFLIQIF